jgi:hypothetical protein
VPLDAAGLSEPPQAASPTASAALIAMASTVFLAKIRWFIVVSLLSREKPPQRGGQDVCAAFDGRLELT